LETFDGSLRRPDLITAASSIPKRKRGDAELTIFVKPESGGSEVKMFTDGLDWGQKVSPIGLSYYWRNAFA
jgi:hypothetical protein